ncbi:hypothetical protein ADK61_03525, partial [Streptomyces sp. XY66]
MSRRTSRTSSAGTSTEGSGSAAAAGHGAMPVSAAGLPAGTPEDGCEVGNEFRGQRLAAVADPPVAGGAKSRLRGGVRRARPPGGRRYCADTPWYRPVGSRKVLAVADRLRFRFRAMRTGAPPPAARRPPPAARRPLLGRQGRRMPYGPGNAPPGACRTGRGTLHPAHAVRAGER